MRLFGMMRLKIGVFEHPLIRPVKRYSNHQKRFDKTMKHFLLSNSNTSIQLNLALLILRIGAGSLMLTHGVPKLMMILDGNFAFGDPLGMGPELSLILVTFAEFLCAIFVMAGLWSRLAVIPLIFAMAVAAFIAHAGDPFVEKELSLFFLITFTTLLFSGPGKYSLDHLFYARK
jgi:putative oxidoreductase